MQQRRAAGAARQAPAGLPCSALSAVPHRPSNQRAAPPPGPPAGTPTPATPSSTLSHLHPLLAFLHQQPYGLAKRCWDEGVQRPFEARQPWGRQQLLALLKVRARRPARACCVLRLHSAASPCCFGSGVMSMSTRRAICKHISPPGPRHHHQHTSPPTTTTTATPTTMLPPPLPPAPTQPPPQPPQPPQPPRRAS
jgi:hypothetical protein